jgi:7,8-dihydro-6-hydroxymethylpterin-pyrophosphokinase
MDIDILLAGDRVISRERLIIPHPRMAGRNFVLVPLREIAPRAVHPVLGVEIEELSAKSGDKSIVRRVRAGLSGKRPGKTKTGRLARQRGEHS